MVEEDVGAAAVATVWMVWLAEQVLVTVPLRTLRITG
jgi:hypothetical protein